MTPRELLLQAKVKLKNAGVPDPETDGALLLSSLTHRLPLSLRVDFDTPLSPEVLKAFEALLARRCTREPLQYLLGHTAFCGLDFAVSPGVLIPRPETELLVDWAAELLSITPQAKVLDLCCGSGCIGLSLKHRLPGLQLTLTDLSADALKIARQNRDVLQLEATLLQGDLFEATDGCLFDCVISNPPYIPSAECTHLQQEVLQEPLTALDGGSDGLDFYRRIAREAPIHLRAGGRLLLELGMGEVSAVGKLLEAHGFSNIQLRRDLAGIERMLQATLPVAQ